ncbi:hypothetical protein PVK06_012103 [Gossypium arboreum]|uniref:Uncharacterized protein n=1 Tax=Gossypium arboreum TaxID=29729 RepID=A0ABR0QAH2_GOSAR|nr:hypothetical protein PVK06_012103 [Gossypium arboreum]
MEFIEATKAHASDSSGHNHLGPYWASPPPNSVKINRNAYFVRNSNTTSLTTVARNGNVNVIDGINAQRSSLIAFLVETLAIRSITMDGTMLSLSEITPRLSALLEVSLA